jgi:hypothetical protein
MAADDTDKVYADVTGHIEATRLAVRQDFDGLTHCLDTAVAIYEAHPSEVHSERSQLRALLTFIRSAQSLSHTLGRPWDDLLALEARAEALRATHH